MRPQEWNPVSSTTFVSDSRSGRKWPIPPRGQPCVRDSTGSVCLPAPLGYETLSPEFVDVCQIAVHDSSSGPHWGPGTGSIAALANPVVHHMKISVGKRLAAGFIAGGIITLSVGLIGWSGLQRSLQAGKEVADLADLRQQLVLRQVDHLNWIHAAGAFLRDPALREVSAGKDGHACQFGTWFQGEARPQIARLLPEAVPLLESIEKPHLNLHKSAADLEKLVRQGAEARDQAVAFFNRETCEHLRQVMEPYDRLVRMADAAVLARTTAHHQAVTRASWVILGCTFAGVALAIAGILLLGRRLSDRLHRLTEMLMAGAEEATLTAGQITGASQVLAEGASSQAAALEETSASLEEMSSMTRRNSENAQSAKQLAGQARAAAERGAADMTRMNEAMNGIKAGSDNIAKIIKTIDEIAFQTNILALNAAVEAARAGEAGMGFAVVAEEVRNLAQRSAQAARETADKIEDSIARSKQAVTITSQVASGLAEITAKAREVDDLVAQIASASQEQSQGISQLNSAVSQMDRVTQSNAASAEETASSAHQLNSQAAHLQSAISDLLVLLEGGTNRPTAPQPYPEPIGDRPPAPRASAPPPRSPNSPPARSLTGPRTTAAPSAVAADSSDEWEEMATPVSPPPPPHGGAVLIRWDPARMSTGVETIDEQHQELIEMINRLHEACRQGKAKEELREMIRFLQDYTVRHFSFEEGVMEEHQCPSRVANRAAHAEFLQRFTDLVEEFDKGHSTSVLVDLKDLTSRWLTSHICGIDSKLKNCVGAGPCAARGHTHAAGPKSGNGHPTNGRLDDMSF